MGKVGGQDLCVLSPTLPGKYTRRVKNKNFIALPSHRVGVGGRGESDPVGKGWLS